MIEIINKKIKEKENEIKEIESQLDLNGDNKEKIEKLKQEIQSLKAVYWCNPRPNESFHLSSSCLRDLEWTPPRNGQNGVSLFVLWLSCHVDRILGVT